MIMNTYRYTAMDLLIAVIYGGLARFCENAATMIFGLAIITVAIMYVKGVKMTTIFGGGRGKISLKTMALRIIVISIGLFIGQLYVTMIIA